MVVVLGRVSRGRFDYGTECYCCHCSRVFERVDVVGVHCPVCGRNLRFQRRR